MGEQRAALREELLASLASSRELAPEHDADLADAFLDRVDEEVRRFEARDTRQPEVFARVMRVGEAAAGILACVLGLLGVQYVHQQFQALATADTLDAHFGAVQRAMQAAEPTMLILAVLVVAVAVGACLHAFAGIRAGLWLLLVSTALLAGCLVLVNERAGDYLATMIFAHYIASWTVPVISTLCVLLASLACGAGFELGRSNSVSWKLSHPLA